MSAILPAFMKKAWQIMITRTDCDRCGNFSFYLIITFLTIC
jgi:hypothetical protein